MAGAIGALSPPSLVAARASLAVLSVTMRPSEVLDCVVQGRFNNASGVAALTDQRVLLVNEREWSPEVIVFEIGIDLVVQGLQDDRSASLTFIGGGLNVTISGITDRPIAHEMARLVRASVAELG
ncbi:MAG: hypothetical protein HYX32_06390 [Actinobacteria bacterium]|nr:hypothetical protein [Actinomycetota bacterium]